MIALYPLSLGACVCLHLYFSSFFVQALNPSLFDPCLSLSLSLSLNLWPFFLISFLKPSIEPCSSSQSLSLFSFFLFLSFYGGRWLVVEVEICGGVEVDVKLRNSD